MEFKNKIEIAGIVGNANVTEVGGTKVVRFSVCTEYMYKSRDGSPVIDVTWFNCSAWEKSTLPPFDKIVKGTPVSLVGRVRHHKYTVDGIERTTFEVLVKDMEILVQQ